MKYVTIQARNIANLDELQRYLDKWSENARPNVQKWINSQLRNYFINTYKIAHKITIAAPNSPEWLKKALANNQDVYDLEILPSVENQFSHVIDFLNTQQGNINYSVLDAIKATEEWDIQRERAIKKAGETKLLEMEEDGIKTIHEYSDGFSWVKVFGEKSLDREGKLMNHCVGSYFDQVKGEKN